MKYLRRYLIHAGLCLLLICSADVASAQMPVVYGLSAPRTNVGPIIRFNVDLSRQLKGNEAISCSADLSNVNLSEVVGASLVDPHSISTCPILFNPSIPALTYNVCMDAGEQGAAIRLELNNPSNTTKTIAIEIACAGVNIAAGVRRDPSRSVRNFTVGPAIFIRSKVFLEGPLQ